MKNNQYDDHYIWGNGRHQRINGIWYRIENNIIVDSDQYRHDLESRADTKAKKAAQMTPGSKEGL